MNHTSLRAVALAQLMEALARLILATSRCDTEQIERLTISADKLAYETEHTATFGY